ncbi:MAG: 7-carboxy-7-deazaguanine synthase QueE [Polyangiales bacterium]
MSTPAPIRLVVAPRAPGTLVVHEIYASIQGESSFAGVPCTFVRLTGCNLRCTYCDTPQAFYGGQRMARAVVLAQALAHRTPLVELTGGEPLLQPDAIPLMRELADAGRTVLLETSGERDISNVDPRVHRIVDLKTPSSGECHRNRLENIPLLTKRDEVKFVIGDRTDYEWAREVIFREELHLRAREVLLSCTFGAMAPREVVSFMIADALPARFQLQLHKYIWPPDQQGV